MSLENRQNPGAFETIVLSSLMGLLLLIGVPQSGPNPVLAVSGINESNVVSLNKTIRSIDGEPAGRDTLHLDASRISAGYMSASALSVSVDDSTYTFGVNLLNTWLTPQTSVITNNGTVAENFLGQISQLTDGSNNWAISSSANGADSVRAQWSTESDTSSWTDISAYATDFTIATNVAASDSVSFWFRIQTPTSTSSYDEYSSTLTVTAQEY